MERFPGIKKLIVGSMDIEKFYPNILSEKSADIVRRMLEESNIPLEMDGEILNMYLSKHLSKEEIAQEKFEDILYTKKPKEKKKVVSKKISKRQVKKKTKKRNQNQDKKENKVKERRDTNFMEGADTPVNVAEELDTKNKIEDKSTSDGADTFTNIHEEEAIENEINDKNSNQGADTLISISEEEAMENEIYDRNHSKGADTLTNISEEEAIENEILNNDKRGGELKPLHLLGKKSKEVRMDQTKEEAYRRRTQKNVWKGP